MSTYFPSPPESTTPPLGVEEVTSVQMKELLELGSEEEAEPPLVLSSIEPVETLADIEIIEPSPTTPTAVYEWPSKPPNHPKDEVWQYRMLCLGE